jgi:hypothetical protein
MHEVEPNVFLLQLAWHVDNEKHGQVDRIHDDTPHEIITYIYRERSVAWISIYNYISPIRVSRRS